MGTVGIIGSLLAIISSIVGYFIWKRQQGSPQARLSKAIEDAFDKQTKIKDINALAANDFDRGDRIDQLLKTVSEISPGKGPTN